MQLKVALIGFGVVGQGLAKLLAEKGSFLKEQYDAEFLLTAVSDVKKGAVADPEGLDPQALLAHLQRSGSLSDFPAAHSGWDALTTIRKAVADVVVEVSWTDVKTGGAALTHLREAFACGRHVVTTNKGPLVVAPWETLEAAAKAGVEFRFEGTVMSGTPVISTARKGLRGCQITGFAGILNGTTNFILTRMEEGLSYEQALAEAQQLGYAEADPSGDVLGWDAAGKVVILVNTVLRKRLQLSEVTLAEGITGISPRLVEEARRAGRRWKLVAQAQVVDGQVQASVTAQALPLSDPLASVSGATNAITFHTDLLGPVTIVGAGAGQKETAFAVLSDLLDIHATLVARHA